MNRLHTTLVALASLVCVASASPKPNFLLLWVDNLGYGDLGCYGNQRNKTPNIDRLASEGVRCTDFYIASPSCSPSRGAILTGRHPERNGLNYQLSSDPNITKQGLPLSEKIIPQYLKPLGYVSGAFGKWNIGWDPGQRPTERGFDEFLGHQSGNIGYYSYLYHGQNDARKGTEPVDLRGRYSTDVFADAAIDFIRRNRYKPWFTYLPFNAVHFVSKINVGPGEKVEWQVPAKYLAKYGSKPDETDQQVRFRATLTALDDAIGRILKVVDELELRERTVVIFISDNGAFMLKDRGLEVQSNEPLRDGGVTTFEGGVRVPAIFRWPGHIKPGSTSREMLSSLDVLPLMMKTAGGELPRNRTFDGMDPLPVLKGLNASKPRSLHWIWNQGKKEQWKGMRQGQFKIVRRADNEDWRLYDLSSDVSESQNLAKDQPERLKLLVSRFEAWRAGIQNDPSRSSDPR